MKVPSASQHTLIPRHVFDTVWLAVWAFCTHMHAHTHAGRSQVLPFISLSFLLMGIFLFSSAQFTVCFTPFSCSSPKTYDSTILPSLTQSLSVTQVPLRVLFGHKRGDPSRSLQANEFMHSLAILFHSNSYLLVFSPHEGVAISYTSS